MNEMQTLEMLTLDEVQQRLRISRSTLRRLINEDRDFRTVKVGKRRRMMTEKAYATFIAAKEAATR